MRNTRNVLCSLYVIGHIYLYSIYLHIDMQCDKIFNELWLLQLPYNVGKVNSQAKISAEQNRRCLLTVSRNELKRVISGLTSTLRNVLLNGEVVVSLLLYRIIKLKCFVDGRYHFYCLYFSYHQFYTQNESYLFK